MDLVRAIQTGQFVFEAENMSGGNDSYQPPLNYTVIQQLYTNDLASEANPIKNQLIVPIGYIAQAPAGVDDYVVAIRGTDSIWEWIQDARFLKTTFTYVPRAGNTEDGFTAMYGSLGINQNGSPPRAVNAIGALLSGKPQATLRIAGHSLGAALATLLAIDVAASGAYTAPEVYTFASPYVGDTQFVSAYNHYVSNTWRIANQVDIVTHLPPSLFFGYEHVGQGYMLNSAGLVKMDVDCNHHLRTYLHLLSILAGGNVIPLDADCAPGG